MPRSRPACRGYAPGVSEEPAPQRSPAGSGSAGWDELDEFATILGRLVDRLRTLSLDRLARPVAGPAGTSPARTAHSIAQWLADAAQGVEERTEPRPPRPRTLPWLGEAVVADQLAVTGNDLLFALRPLAADVEVWAGRTRGTAGGVTRAAVAELRRLYPL